MTAIIVAVTDITQRKATADALQQSEERHRIISEVISDYVYTSNGCEDSTMRTRWVSGAFEQITGYTIDEIREIGGWLNIIDPIDLIAMTESMLDCTVGQNKVFEYRIITKSGETRWLRDHVRLSNPTQQPELLRLYGAVQDITERKQAEAMLDQYRHIVAATADMIAMIDCAGIYVYANDAYLRRSGRSYEQLIGHSVAEVMGQQTFDGLIQERLQRCLQGETVQYRTWLDLAGAGQRFLDATYIPYHNENGDIVGVLISARDITDLKQMTDELQASEARYRLLADHAQDIIFQYQLQPELCCLYVSPSIEGILGYPAEAFYTDPWLYYSICDTETQRFLEAGLMGSTDTYPATAVLRMRHCDGHYVWMEQHVRITTDADGRAAMIQGISRDVTERKQMQEALQQSKERYRLVSEIISDYAYSFEVNADGSLTLEWTTESSFQRVTGFTCTELEQRGGWASLIYPEDIPVAQNDSSGSLRASRIRANFAL
ncbi:MAG: PAS domain S-box protein [Chloroflexaceae bacterium]|nr:PAS domain S-box protein [Chloroflexaceae bacterium]